MTTLLHLAVVLLVVAIGRNVARCLALVVIDTLEYLWLRFMPNKLRREHLRTAITQLRILRHELGVSAPK